MKQLYFIGTARDDLKKFPEEVRQDIGYCLHEAQCGGKSGAARPMKGFGGAGVLEIRDDFDGDTYRAVYTVKFKEAIYVLHCFQKKSKNGIQTPRQEIELIKRRLKVAEDDYKTNYT